VVGTSAGAQVGALLRAGMSADDLAARVTDEPMTPAGAAIARHYRRPAVYLPHPDHPKRLRPSAPRYLWRTLTRPWEARPSRLVAALLPSGRASQDEEAEGYRALFGDRWPELQLWIPAVHLDSGCVVIFGRNGSPSVDVGTAVICSGAVPSVCAPVLVDGQRYIDGGMATSTHLDVLHDQPLDAVIASSPLSHMPGMGLLFRREVRRLRRAGHRVVALEPRGVTKRAMGYNPMDMQRAGRVARAAYEEGLRAIEAPEHREVLAQTF